MKKISFNFLNRFEQFILKNRSEEYAPVSSSIAVAALVGAIVGVLGVFVLQMTNSDESLGAVILSVAFGGVFLYSAYKVYKSMAHLPEVGGKVGLAVYAFVLFSVTSLAFLFLVMWALIIALVIGVCLLILKFALGSSGGSKGRVYYNDGTSEEVVEDGKGICGETYYKSESGRTHVEP